VNGFLAAQFLAVDRSFLGSQDSEMMTRTMGMALLLSFAAGAICFAGDNPTAGTWKLNAAKSKFGEGATKLENVVWSTVGDQEKVTSEGTDGSGKKVKGEWTGKLDGKDYPLTGDANADMRAFKKIDDKTIEITSKKDGKVVGTGTIVIAPDGKSRTVTTTMTNAKGEKVTTTAVYDKQ
jgi:hypothetical protein